MLHESTCFRKIYIACGRTDLRKGIDGLVAMIRQEFNLDPFEPNILYLFCGTKKDRIKGLVWEGDGFVLLYSLFLLRIGIIKYQIPKEGAVREWPKNTIAMNLRAWINLP